MLQDVLSAHSVISNPWANYLLQCRAEGVREHYASRQTWNRRRSPKFVLLINLVELDGTSGTVRKLGYRRGNPVIEIKYERTLPNRFISDRFSISMNDPNSFSNGAYV